MVNNAPLFLGFRYLKPKRSFVSTITLICIAGITLGVAVLIIVISVMKGFEMDFKNLLIGFESHVELKQRDLFEGEDPRSLSKWQDLKPLVEKLPGVVSAAPFVRGVVFVKAGQQATGIEIYGMPEQGSEAMRQKLSKHLLPPLEGEPAGSMDLDGDIIVINDQVAGQLNLRVGDKVTVFATGSMPQVVDKLGEISKKKAEAEKAKLFDEINELIMPQDLTVTGILRGDSTWGRCYLPLRTAQELFGLRGRVHGIGLELKNPHDAPAFVDRLIRSETLPPDWGAGSWVDRHASRLAAIQNERVMMWFVLSFVVLVAAFSVAATTLTVTVQKRREIGILTALGMRLWQIVGVFLTQASVVALVGTVLGYVAGMTFLFFRNDIRDGLASHFGIQIFPQDIYFLSEIPAQTQTSDVIIVCGVSVVLCLIAAFLPAFFAARVDPAVALRDT